MNKFTIIMPREATATPKEDLKSMLERIAQKQYPFAFLKPASKINYEEDEEQPNIKIYTAKLLSENDDERSLSYLPREYRYAGNNVEAAQEARKISLYAEFFDIMNRYEKNYKGTIKKTKSKDYDFVNVLGEPVKVYQNFIQVGYTLIPRNDYSAIKKSKHAKKIENIMSRIIDIVNASR